MQTTPFFTWRTILYHKWVGTLSYSIPSFLFFEVIFFIYIFDRFHLKTDNFKKRRFVIYQWIIYATIIHNLYSRNSSFGETTWKWYLLHLPFVYGIECLQKSTNKNIFCTYSIDGLTDEQNLWSCGSISSKLFRYFLRLFSILRQVWLRSRTL